MSDPAQSEQAAQGEEFRRKVFYLSGYDPRGARFYHWLYSQQADIYARNSGHDITVSARKRSGPGNHAWTVRDETDRSTSEFEFLGWDEVIRGTWGRNPAKLVWDALRATLAFTAAWEWRKYAHRIPKPSYIAFYYPALSVTALPVLLIAIIWLAAGPIAGIIIGIAASVLVARVMKSLWLMRFIIFNDRISRGEPIAKLDERLTEMAGTIGASLGEDWDEILLATHSNGSVLAMPIMERLLSTRDQRMPENFALITLGSCIPVLAMRQDATEFRRSVAAVAQGDFLWLDLGSPTDGACLPLVDPCITSESRHRPEQYILSPRWFKYCDPATYQQRRRNKYETHFEYLRTFESISPLDYLRVTSCAQPLRNSIAAFTKDNT